MDGKAQITEEQFLSIVSMIACRHGCRIEHVNFANKVVTINCPDPGKDNACAIDLAQALSRYTV
jgi:hypothetical protein